MVGVVEGDRVWLPTRLRDAATQPVDDRHLFDALAGEPCTCEHTDCAQLAVELAITCQPGVVASVEDGWVMVDRSPYGQFGYPADELEPAEGHIL